MYMLTIMRQVTVITKCNPSRRPGARPRAPDFWPLGVAVSFGFLRKRSYLSSWAFETM